MLQQLRLYLFSFWSKQHNGRQSAVKISHLAGQIWFHQDKDLWHWLLFTDFTLGRLNGSTQRHFLQQHKFISERDLRQAETGGSRLVAPHKQIIWPDFVELFMRAWQTYYCQLLISLQLTGNWCQKNSHSNVFTNKLYTAAFAWARAIYVFGWNTNKIKYKQKCTHPKTTTKSAFSRKNPNNLQV